MKTVYAMNIFELIYHKDSINIRRRKHIARNDKIKLGKG